MRHRAEGSVPTEEESREDPRDRLEGADLVDFRFLQRRLEKAGPAFEKLALSLRGDIEQGKWDSIVVDDASGRHVGAFIRRIVKRFAKEHDTQLPKFGFLHPDRGSVNTKEQLIEYVEEHQDEVGDNVLVVTEFIASGKSIQSLRDMFEWNGIKVDIATLSHVSDVEVIKNVRGSSSIKKRRAKLHMGGDSKDKFPEYQWKLPGVGVRKKEGIHTERNRDSGLLVAAARLEVNELADGVYDKFFADDAPEKKGY